MYCVPTFIGSMRVCLRNRRDNRLLVNLQDTQKDHHHHHHLFLNKNLHFTVGLLLLSLLHLLLLILLW